MVIAVRLLSNGNSRVSRFKGRFTQAEDADDKEEIDLLELFEKDLGSFCRMYNFLSQVVRAFKKLSRSASLVTGAGCELFWGMFSVSL